MCLHEEGRRQPLQRNDDDDEYQKRLGQLQSLLREFVNWDVEEQRLELLRRLDPLLVQWTSHCYDVLGFFQEYEIPILLKDAINCQEGEPEDLADVGRRFIEFVLRSGYRDRPDCDAPASRTPKPFHRTTPLHLATGCPAASGYLRALFELYPRLDLTYTDRPSGLAHLHLACINGYLDLVARYLDRVDYGVDHRVLGTDETPLHLAARHRRWQVAQLLLERGADGNARDLRGRSPLHALCAAARAENDEEDVVTAGTLFDHHREVRDDARGPRDNWGGDSRYPLLRSIMSPLADVSFAYYRPALELNARDEAGGDTPLQLALCNGKVKLAAFLLEKDAWPTQLCTNSNWAERCVNCSQGDSPLHLAIKLGLERTTWRLLMEGADPNRENELEGATPLQLAVESLQPRLVEVLLDCGARPHDHPMSRLDDFVFPTEVCKGAEVVALEKDPDLRDAFKLRLAAATLFILELLERARWKLGRADALKIMRFFAKHGLFETRSAAKRRFDHLYYMDERAARWRTRINDRLRPSWMKRTTAAARQRRRRVVARAPRVMINRRVSLYNLLRKCSPTERAATRRRVTYEDYYEFACSSEFLHMAPRGRRKPCVALHLCEIMSRSFFSGWAVKCLMRLTRRSKKFCETIVARLTENRKMWDICEAAVDIVRKSKRELAIDLARMSERLR